MAIGVVRMIDKDKRFGFIRPDGDPRREDVFFHQSSCTCDFQALHEGDRVAYAEEPGAKGPRARDVALA